MALFLKLFAMLLLNILQETFETLWRIHSESFHSSGIFMIIVHPELWQEFPIPFQFDTRLWNILADAIYLLTNNLSYKQRYIKILQKISDTQIIRILSVSHTEDEMSDSSF